MSAFLFAATGLALALGWAALVGGVLWLLYTATRPETDDPWEES